MMAMTTSSSMSVKACGARFILLRRTGAAAVPEGASGFHVALEFLDEWLELGTRVGRAFVHEGLEALGDDAVAGLGAQSGERILAGIRGCVATFAGIGRLEPGLAQASQGILDGTAALRLGHLLEGGEHLGDAGGEREFEEFGLLGFGHLCEPVAPFAGQAGFAAIVGLEGVEQIRQPADGLAAFLGTELGEVRGLEEGTDLRRAGLEVSHQGETSVRDGPCGDETSERKPEWT